jgi:hypothetical protein
MKKKEKKAGPPKAARGETATPFFARYLEGQDAEAKVGEGRSQPNFTYKETARGGTKKGGAKAAGGTKAAGGAKAAGGTKAAAKPPIQTLKYPSDRDEWIFYPYHPEAATTTTKAKAETLKYPSDSDEQGPYYAVYSDAAEAPKATASKAKAKETGVRLSRRKPKG